MTENAAPPMTDRDVLKALNAEFNRALLVIKQFSKGAEEPIQINPLDLFKMLKRFTATRDVVYEHEGKKYQPNDWMPAITTIEEIEAMAAAGIFSRSLPEDRPERTQ